MPQQQSQQRPVDKKLEEKKTAHRKHNQYG